MIRLPGPKWSRKTLVIALVVTVAAFVLLFVLHPGGGQRNVFYAQGSQMFSDYHLTQGVAAEIHPYSPVKAARVDACYPALAIILIRLFPWTESGAIVFTVISFLAFLAALEVLVIRCRLPPATGLLFVVTAPVLFSLGCGNLIILAVAGTVLFIAWHDSAKPWQRIAAALALAFAGVLKVSPAIFILLYLPGRQWRDFLLCATVAVALFLVPFWCVGDGLDGFIAWIGNAAENSRYYELRHGWGFVAVDRTLRVARHLPFDAPWAAVPYERAAAIVLGFVSVGGALVAHDRFLRVTLLAAAVLLIPANAMAYCGLYLVPAAILFLASPVARRTDWAVALLFLAILIPLQFPLGPGSLNRPLANLAFLALDGVCLFRARAALNSPARSMDKS